MSDNYNELSIQLEDIITRPRMLGRSIIITCTIHRVRRWKRIQTDALSKDDKVGNKPTYHETERCEEVARSDSIIDLM